MGKRKRDNPSYSMSTQEVYDKVKFLKNRVSIAQHIPIAHNHLIIRQTCV